MSALSIDIDINAIADAVAERISVNESVWNCPNALVSPRSIATYCGYSERQVRHFLSQYGAPSPVQLPCTRSDGEISYTDRRYFVKDIVQYFEKHKKSKN